MTFDRPRNVWQRLGVAEQVDVALPVPLFDVGQAVPLLGRRQQALAQERQRRGEDGQLAGPGVAERAVDADQVAQVELARPGSSRPRRPGSCRRRPGSRSVQSRSSRKLTFPCPRRSMIRPATRTLGRRPRRPPSGSVGQRPVRGRRRSPDGRRTAGPRGRCPRASIFPSFSRRTASRASRDSSAITRPCFLVSRSSTA